MGVHTGRWAHAVDRDQTVLGLSFCRKPKNRQRRNNHVENSLSWPKKRETGGKKKGGKEFG